MGGFAFTTRSNEGEAILDHRELIFVNLLNDLTSSTYTRFDTRIYGECVHIEAARASHSQKDSVYLIQHKKVSLICGFYQVQFTMNLNPNITLEYKNATEVKSILSAEEQNSVNSMVQDHQYMKIRAYN